MILFSIEINIEQISDLNELLEISMQNFKKKISLVKDIDKDYEQNLKKIDELNLKKATITRKNKEKSEKLLKFIVNELNKKKKNNMALNEQINSLFAADDKKKNQEEAIEEEKNDDKDSDVSIGSIGEEDKKNNKEQNKGENSIQINSDKNVNENQISGNNNVNNEANKDDEDSDLSLTDL